MSLKGFSDADINEALEKLRLTVVRMARSLDIGPWLAGEMFTLADISVLPSIVRMEDLGIAHLWRDLPAVADWYARAKARPSFAACYYAGSRDIIAKC